MLPRDGQSSIPPLKIVAGSRAEGQARKRPLLGRALGLHRAKAGSAAGSTGSREGVGAVSPVMVIT